MPKRQAVMMWRGAGAAGFILGGKEGGAPAVRDWEGGFGRSLSDTVCGAERAVEGRDVVIRGAARIGEGDAEFREAEHVGFMDGMSQRFSEGCEDCF